jgi:hypothetical protein
LVFALAPAVTRSLMKSSPGGAITPFISVPFRLSSVFGLKGASPSPFCGPNGFRGFSIEVVQLTSLLAIRRGTQLPAANFRPCHS